MKKRIPIVLTSVLMMALAVTGCNKPLLPPPPTAPEEVARNVFVIGKDGHETEVTLDNISETLTSGAQVEVRDGGQLLYNTTGDSSRVRFVDISAPAEFRIITADNTVNNDFNWVQNYNIQLISGAATFDIQEPLITGEYFTAFVNKRIGKTYTYEKWALPVTGTAFRVDVASNGNFYVLFFEGESLLHKDNEPIKVLGGGEVVKVAGSELNVEKITIDTFDTLSPLERKIVDRAGGTEVIIESSEAERRVEDVDFPSEHLKDVYVQIDNFEKISNLDVTDLIKELKELSDELAELESQLRDKDNKITDKSAELNKAVADHTDVIAKINSELELLTEEKIVLENNIEQSEKALAAKEAQFRRELERIRGELDDTIANLNSALGELDAASARFTQVSSELSYATLERDKISAELMSAREKHINAMMDSSQKLDDTLARHAKDLAEAERTGGNQADEIRAEMQKIVGEKDALAESLQVERDNLINECIREQEGRASDFEKMESDLAKALADGDARAAMLENKLKSEIESRESLAERHKAQLDGKAADLAHLQEERNAAVSQLELELAAALLAGDENAGYLRLQLQAAVEARDLAEAKYLEADEIRKTEMARVTAERNTIAEELDARRVEWDNKITRLQQDLEDAAARGQENAEAARIELSIALAELDALNTRIKNERDALIMALDKAGADYEAAIRRIEQLIASDEASEFELAELQYRLNALSSEYDELLARLACEREQTVILLEEERAKNERRQAELMQRIAEKDEDFTRLQSVLNAANAAFADTIIQLADERTKLIESYEAVLAAKDADIAGLAERIAYYQGNHEEIEVQLAQYRERAEEKDAQIQKLREQHDAAIADITVLEAKLAADQPLMDSLTKEVAGLIAQVNARNERVMELEETVHLLAEAYESRIDELNEAINSFLEIIENDDHELRHELAEAYRTLDQLKVQHAMELARVTEEHEGKIRALEDEVTGLMRLIDAGVAGQDGIMAELAAAKRKLAVAEADMAWKDTVIEELRDILAERNGEIETLIEENCRLVLEIDDLRASDGDSEEIIRLQAQISSLHTELDNKNDRLNELEKELEWALTQVSNYDMENILADNKALLDYVEKIDAWLNELEGVIRELPPGHQQFVRNWLLRKPALQRAG